MTSRGGRELAIDTDGHVLLATSAGIERFVPDGGKCRTTTAPMAPASCALGDADHETSHITARRPIAGPPPS